MKKKYIWLVRYFQMFRGVGAWEIKANDVEIIAETESAYYIKFKFWGLYIKDWVLKDGYNKFEEIKNKDNE